MPWVRIDENAIDHPKFLALSANAFRLWFEGQAYCQKHLTDGIIPRQALKGFRYYSPASFKMLTSALVSGKQPLWIVNQVGVRVHDYFDWNDSREVVLKSRQEAQDRKRRWRDKQLGMAPPPETRSETRSGTRSETRPSLSGVGTRESESSMERGVGKTTEERAGAFCEWYEDTHQRLFGIGYIGTNSDFMAAQRLCEKLSDQEVRDAALVWFGQDDDFATNGTRSIPKFASRASGCLQEARKRGIA